MAFESQPTMIESTPPTPGEKTSLTTHQLPPAPSRYALPPAPPKKPPSKLRFLWWLVLAALLFAGYKYWPRIQSTLSPPSQPTSGSKKGGKGGGGASPVVATRAHRGNIPVYFSTIGSVTPIYTTILQSRVVGELMNVHYKEGDMVQKGELLIEIDPRPFQVQLEQAEGQLAKDQAVAQRCASRIWPATRRW